MTLQSPVLESLDAHLEARRVLSRAVLRAADLLKLTQDDLAAILGTSPASISRMRAGKRLIEGGRGERGEPDASGGGSKEFELACLFLRVFRSLDALIGGDPEKSRAWLVSENRHLGGAPLALLKTIPGIAHVADYLDAMRGKT